MLLNTILYFFIQEEEEETSTHLMHIKIVNYPYNEIF